MIQVIHLLPDGELRCGGTELLATQPAEGTLTWIDVEGLTPENRALIESMGFHPLAVEDTFTLAHQPRFEEYDGFLFVIVRGIDFNRTHERLETLKLACFLSAERLVTVHRAPLRSIRTLQRRLEELNRAPRGGLAHLLYLLYDELIGLYLPVVDEIADQIEALEEELFEEPRQEHLARILALKQRLGEVRRVMLPHRQIFNHLATGSAREVSDHEGLYFRDVYDQVVRLTDAVDVQREQLSSVRDTYLSVLSQRTNEIMKVLTLISAILLPLGLIAGIYGMNFQHMPELASRWGYPIALGAMATVAVGMLLWFKRKGWV